MNVELPCPKCGKTIMVALSSMSANNTVDCTTCGEVIRFAGADALAALKAVEDLQKLAGPAVSVDAGITVEVKGSRPWWKFWSA